jgi:hypothetical protein
MIVIPPIQVTESNLISSSVSEPSTGETVWNASTNYSLGQVVIRTTTHRKYENTIAGVDSGLPENTPTRWLDVGPTNKWAMFDQNRNMATTNPASMTVSINPGKRINSIALLGVQANTVTITMKVGSTTIYGPITRNMNGRLTTTWSEYFFGEFDYTPNLILLDLPPAANATVTVQFDNPSNTVACSGIVLGAKVYLGKIQYNAKSDSLNFSKIERDEFGNSLLIRRRTIPKTTQTLWVDKVNVNNVRKVRENLNAVPALWSGLDDDTGNDYSQSLTIFGIYKQFEIDIGHPQVATVNLELEEL